MMNIGRKRCSYFTVCFIALLCLCNSILAQTTTDKKATFVFRVSFGKALNNIGVQWSDTANGGITYDEATCGITVLPNGDITIGDYVQGKIKRFSPKGELLGVTEGSAGVVSSYSTDSDGNIYVCAEMSVAKFGKDGHFLWRKTARDLIPDEQFVKAEKDMNAKIDRSFSGLVDANKTGWLIVKLRAKGGNDTSSHSIGAVFDNNGKFIKFLSYFPRVSGGLFWSYKLEKIIENDNEPPGPVIIRIYSERGTFVKELKPEIYADNGVHYKQRIGDGGVDIFTDNRDSIWVKCRAKLDKPIEIKKGVTVNGEYLLNKYDINGAFVEELHLPHSPFMSDLNFTVSEDGTLYYMQFDKDGINVMAYK